MPERDPTPHRAARLDAAVLAAVLLVAVAPHLPRLGFHADDWAFLGGLTGAADTLPARLRALWQPDLRMRPVQVLLLAGTYHLFGPAPLAFHLVNAAALVVGALCLHLVLRELGARPTVAVAVPLVYALLPQYSAVRFWVAATPATVAMALCFASAYADLRAVRPALPAARRGAWLALAAAARAAGVLAYEVFLPLLVLAPLVVWLHLRRARATARGDAATSWLARPVGLLALGALTAATLAPVVAYKLAVTTKLHRDLGTDHLRWLWWTVRGAARITLVDFGVAFPRTLWRLARDHPTPLALPLAAAAGALTMWHLARTGMRERAARASHGIAMVVAGAALFPLGYGVFLGAKQAEFSATGIATRTTIAATLGVAMAWVGLAYALGAAARRPAARAWAFATLTGGMVAACVFVHATLAQSWATAWRRERAALAAIEGRFPSLPDSLTLLLDGVCPYVGPAIVFESPWDLRGALWTTYRRYDVEAHPVTPSLSVEDSAIVSSLYHASLVKRYPYRRVVVFDAARGTTLPLADAAAARRFLAARAAVDRCPRGVEGDGVRMF